MSPRSPRGPSWARPLLGPTADRLLAAAVLVLIFGCLSSALIAASRLGLPMSEDAPAFRWMSRIHPRYNTPTAGIVTLGAWSMLLVLTGSYEQLFKYVVFSGIIFHVIAGLALFQLRRQRPAAHSVAARCRTGRSACHSFDGDVPSLCVEQPCRALGDALRFLDCGSLRNQHDPSSFRDAPDRRTARNDDGSLDVVNGDEWVVTRVDELRIS